MMIRENALLPLFFLDYHSRRNGLIAVGIASAGVMCIVVIRIIIVKSKRGVLVKGKFLYLIVHSCLNGACNMNTYIPTPAGLLHSRAALFI